MASPSLFLTEHFTLSSLSWGWWRLLAEDNEEMHSGREVACPGSWAGAGWILPQAWGLLSRACPCTRKFFSHRVGLTGCGL